jgi:hypothetical protein
MPWISIIGDQRYVDLPLCSTPPSAQTYNESLMPRVNLVALVLLTVFCENNSASAGSFTQIQSLSLLVPKYPLDGE